MKKNSLLLALFVLAQTSFAQKIKTANVPEAVKTVFAQSYPQADDIHWEKEAGNYEVEFELSDDQEMSVLYDKNGVLLETEVEIAFMALPSAVQEALKGKKVKEIAKITNSKGIVTYEAEVKRQDLMFDAQGRPVK